MTTNSIPLINRVCANCVKYLLEILQETFYNMRKPTQISSNCEKHYISAVHCWCEKILAILRQFQTSLLMENLKLIELGNEL